MQAALERRQHPRHDVNGLAGELYRFTDAQALNVNLLGAALRISQRVQIGQRYRLRLQGDGGGLTLIARVVRCTLKQLTPAPLYEVGLEFEDLLAERAQQVLGFLAGNARCRPGQRLIERLRLAPGARIGLETAHGFAVKRLSLAGMLIQTETALAIGHEPLEVVCVLPLGGTDLETPARIVASSSPAAVGEASQTLGLSFTRLSRKARGVLREYLAGCATKARSEVSQLC